MYFRWFNVIVDSPVHVVGSGSGVVSDPDTEVLDDKRVLLLDLLDRDDLSGGLLELTQLTQEVPEPKKNDKMLPV